MRAELLGAPGHPLAGALAEKQAPWLHGTAEAFVRDCFVTL